MMTPAQLNAFKSDVEQTARVEGWRAAVSKIESAISATLQELGYNPVYVGMAAQLVVEFASDEEAELCRDQFFRPHLDPEAFIDPGDEDVGPMVCVRLDRGTKR